VITQVAVGVVLFVLAVLYVSWTAGRLDRLHARVDAAWAALDAALVRRAAAARAVAAALPPGAEADALERAARATLELGAEGREGLENDLSRALRAAVPVLPAAADLTELAQASTRVGLARSFHNAAVRDTRVVRQRRIPRALHLAGHRELPQYFEIDDTTVPH
jgi:alpha-beta hydrolase superfamily lysophospholipase